MTMFSFLAISILSLIYMHLVTSSRALYTPEIISYTEAESTGQKIFHPHLLLLSHPYGEKVAPTPGDIVVYFGTDKTPPGSHPDEVQRGRIYDPSAIPGYQGKLTCAKEKLEIWFYLWSVVKVLKEKGDEWCCQTGNDAQSIATYSRATVGLSGMKGLCMRCYDVGFAADEVMYSCGRRGDVGGRYVFRAQGRYPEVVVYHSRDRDLGGNQAQESNYYEL